MNGRRWMAMAMSVGVLLAKPSAAAEIDRPTVIVRTYLAAALADTDWRAAVRETDAILDGTGIARSWISCSGPDPSKRCTEPLKINEVIVRVVRANTPAHNRPEVTLGESLLDLTDRRGRLATVYLDRVERLARDGRVRTSTVLARAVAHELGHLLMGVPDHSRAGLMRPSWTGAELRRGLMRDWTFTRTDAARIIANLRRP